MLRTLDGCVHSADSHPKVTVMCQLVLEHFAEHGESTRVMIFSTYRESVAELTGRLGKVAGVPPTPTPTLTPYPEPRTPNPNPYPEP